MPHDSRQATESGGKVRATELRGGLFVDTDAILLALDLESRGHTLTARDGALLVTDGSRLSAEDRTKIQRLKRHLLAIAAYIADDVEPRVGARALGTEAAPASESVASDAAHSPPRRDG